MKSTWVGILVTVIAGIVLFGCQNAIGTNDAGKAGSLTVSINEQVSRSLLPTISMDPASYVITGTGPSGATFSQTLTGTSSVNIEKLAFGDWTVDITAKNASGTNIGTGAGTATVHSNSTSNVSITVKPYDGFGTLNLDVAWTANQVETAQIESTLMPSTGASRTLAFAINGTTGTGSFNASDVPTGYHTLVLKLKDNGYLCMGAVEVVRIIKDQTTSGSYTFADINQATGTLQVNVAPEMADPLSVSISGALATKAVNQSLSLAAAVSNYAENVSYVWYVNGDAVSTGATYSFGDTWAQGYYRIDVTAFSADGKRAGSATTNVQVVAAVAGNENYTSATVGTLVYVPAGSFQRDATVTNISVITQPYRMSATEITRAQFLAIMGTDPSYTPYSSGTSDPVQYVNWYHAITFCNKLSIAEGLTSVYAVTGVDFATLTYADIPTSDNATWNAASATWTNNGYRLPTEMEWMWAAMGATMDRSNSYTGSGTNTTGYTKGYAGSTETAGAQTNIGNYAWYSTNSSSKTHPAGSKTVNELGLYDMSGNVWEWNWDWYGTYPTGAQTDYRGAASGTNRVGRGGSWINNATNCTVAYRSNFNPYIQDLDIGFRVVRP